MTTSFCTELAEISPGMVSVFYMNQAEYIWSFPSECACAFSLSDKCLSRKEAKEKVEKRQRGWQKTGNDTQATKLVAFCRFPLVNTAVATGKFKL